MWWYIPSVWVLGVTVLTIVLYQTGERSKKNSPRVRNSITVAGLIAFLGLTYLLLGPAILWSRVRTFPPTSDSVQEEP